jgi:hypothetical protein
MAEILDSSQLADQFFQQQKDAHNNPAGNRGLAFPVQWFMKMTGGIKPGWLSFVYGQAKAGKTSCMLSMARQNGHDKHKFIYFSLEEPNLLVASRLFAAEANISRIKFRDILLEDSDWSKLSNAADVIRGFCAYWVYGAFDLHTMVKIINDIDPDGIYIDHIQLMDAIRQTRDENKTQIVSENSRALRRVANGDWPGLKVHRTRCVTVAGQLNDEGKVLYSRDLDRDADLTFSIDRKPDGVGGWIPNKRVLAIRLFRHGDVGQTDIDFIGERSMIMDNHVGAMPSVLKKP